MEKLLKGIFYSTFLLLTLGVIACSSDSSSSNNNKAETTESPTNKTLAAPLPSGDCDRPDEVLITNAAYQSAGNYILTYSWNSVSGATGYEFELLINGNSAFQNLSLTDTFITLPQAIAATDDVKASVKTICGSKKSDSAKESSSFKYMNAVSTDEVIFLMDPTNSVSDICAKSCQKIKFTGGSILNSDGTVINLSKPDMKVYYYDYNAVKSCVQCNSSGGAPVVDPVAFNNCLDSPLSQYWIFDPGQYKECK